MCISIIVGNQKLRLAVLAIYDRRRVEAQTYQAIPEAMDVARCPVQPQPLKVLGLDGGTRAPVQPESQTFTVNHATDKTTLVMHGPIHGKSETIYPESQTSLEVRAWHDGNT
jgi:hypothetical protein